VDELAKFLRKNNRALKLASLQALGSLLGVPQYSSKLGDGQYAVVIAESRQLISDSDLQLLPLSLGVIIKVLQVHPQSLPAVKETIVPPALDLVVSPLLQGASLTALLDLLATIVQTDVGLFGPLVTKLQGIPKPNESISAAKHTFTSLSQAIAALCAAVPTAQSSATINSFVESIKSGDDQSPEPAKYLALLTLGEIGRRMYGQSDIVTFLRRREKNKQRSEWPRTTARDRPRALQLGFGRDEVGGRVRHRQHERRQPRKVPPAHHQRDQTAAQAPVSLAECAERGTAVIGRRS